MNGKSGSTASSSTSSSSHGHHQREGERASPSSPTGATYTSPNDVAYFHGRINRAESCLILMKKNVQNVNGMFLLRERLENIGDYTLTIYHEGQFHHYRIMRCPEDGMVKIAKGTKFVGPVELVRHHQARADGLVCRLTEPCERNKNIKPIYYFSVNYNEFYTLVENKIKQQLAAQYGISVAELSGVLPSHIHAACEEARGRYRYKYEKLVLNELHLTQHWFKPNVDRHQAEEIFRRSASMADGTFMVRSDFSVNSSSSGSTSSSGKTASTMVDHASPYKISICFNGEIKHYRIYMHEERWALLDGKEFDSLIQLVDYYHRCSDGLVMKLMRPIVHDVVTKVNPIKPARLHLDEPELDDLYDTNKAYNDMVGQKDIQLIATPYHDDEPTNGGSDVRDLSVLKEKDRRFFRNEESYDYQNRSKKSSIIDYSRLVFCDQLGSGCFGSVSRGTYTDKNGIALAVAIKTLNVDSNENRAEIEKEARIMQSLDHPNIIRLIGTCSNNNSLMIVMELAKLGPLHKYLRTMKQKMSMKKIVLLCHQVARAMEYLAFKNLVHRDLAARNVLLVSEDIAKVSDFGMSRAMNEQNYYTSKASGKWPLKWYPIEASVNGIFDEKSDVWSFGVTCWEATSYGARPYQGVSINLLFMKIQNGYRLEKPKDCPDDLYNIMDKCWRLKKNDRPRFAQIVRDIEAVLVNVYQVEVD